MKLVKNRIFLITGILVLLLSGFSGCTIKSIFVKPAGIYINLGDAKSLDLSVITSVDLNISGPDMDTISKTYTYDELTSLNWIINIDVPSGDNITFEITAHVNSGSVITGYYGKAQTSISGDTKDVDVHLGITGEKLLTANPFENAGGSFGDPSIVVMDDIDGTNWKRITEAGVNGWAAGTSNAYFYPWDMDVDEYGNIIVVNNDSYGAIVWRFSSIDAPVYEPVITSLALNGLVAVAVDRKNQFIYYADSSTLYRCDYKGLNSKSYSDQSISGITGLAVDSSGIVFIATGSQVTKYDPSGTGSLIKSITIKGTATVEDVMVKNGYVYAADSGNNQIIKLDTDLTNVVDTYTGPQGVLYGPRRFVGTLNAGIYFIDETGEFTQAPENDRLIYIDDISGSGYKSYGQTGYSDPGGFSFYHGPLAQ